MSRPHAVAIAPILLSLLLACGDDSEGPAPSPGPPAPGIPEVSGDYDATWRFTLTDVARGQTTTLECPGALSIPDQTDGTFTGTFSVRETEDCRPLTGNLRGSVGTDGAITLAPVIGEGDPSMFEAETGCVEVEADRELTGTFVNDRIDAQANASVQCRIGEEDVAIAIMLGLTATRR